VSMVHLIDNRSSKQSHGKRAKSLDTSARGGVDRIGGFPWRSLTVPFQDLPTAAADPRPIPLQALQHAKRIGQGVLAELLDIGLTGGAFLGSALRHRQRRKR
jgi:hypothetical protein